MIFLIIIIGIIFAYLMRAFDILIAFKEVNITISFKDSIKILILMTKNYIQLTKNRTIDKKDITTAYLFHFSTLLVFLTSIIKDATLLTDQDKIAMISVKKEDNIIDMVRNSLPVCNNKKFNVADE